MPLVQVHLRAGKDAPYRQALLDGIYRAMRETFNVPEGDEFMTLTEHDAANFRNGGSYLGIPRSDDLVIIRITANNTRSLEQKKALYAAITKTLAEHPGVRPEDVFVSLVEVPKENWSMGLGQAPYA